MNSQKVSLLNIDRFENTKFMNEVREVVSWASVYSDREEVSNVLVFLNEENRGKVFNCQEINSILHGIGDYDVECKVRNIRSILQVNLFAIDEVRRATSYADILSILNRAGEDGALFSAELLFQISKTVNKIRLPLSYDQIFNTLRMSGFSQTPIPEIFFKLIASNSAKWAYAQLDEVRQLPQFEISKPPLLFYQRMLMSLGNSNLKKIDKEGKAQDLIDLILDSFEISDQVLQNISAALRHCGLLSFRFKSWLVSKCPGISLKKIRFSSKNYPGEIQRKKVLGDHNNTTEKQIAYMTNAKQKKVACGLVPTVDCSKHEDGYVHDYLDYLNEHSDDDYEERHEDEAWGAFAERDDY